MPLNEILAIKEAEARSEVLRNNALAEAKKIRANAVTSGQNFYESAIAEASQKAEALLHDVSLTDTAEYKQIMESSRREEEAMTTTALKKMDQAAQLILERIVND